MGPTPSKAPSTPASPSRIDRLLSSVQSEVVLIGGAIVTVGEALSPLIPPGQVRTLFQVSLPILASIVVRARTFPVARLEALIQTLRPRKG